jgi:hypothetical protein
MSGGTIPLNYQFLLEVLHAASSQSQELVQQASAQLKEWEKQSGYWILLQVCAIHDVCVCAVRVICLHSQY